MIADYTRPQTIIKQQLQRLPNGGQRVIGAFTLGPQFFLSRYNNLAERAKMVGMLFEKVTSTDAADHQVVPAENKLAGHVVDLGYSRLFAENLEGQLCVMNRPSATLSSAVSTAPIRARLLSLSQPNRLRLTHQGLVIALTFAGNALSSVGSIVSGGLGFEPSRSSGYTIPVAGVTAAGVALAGTGGLLAVTTDSTGKVLTASLSAGGSGYANETGVVVEITPPNLTANLREVDNDDVPLYSGLRGRAVQAGDIVYATYTDPNTTEVKTFRRSVLRVDRDQVASHVGSNSSEGVLLATDQLFSEDASRNPRNAATAAFESVAAPTGWGIGLSSISHATHWNGMLEGSTYGGRYAERYTITIVQSGTGDVGETLATARLRIRSHSGGFVADDVGAVAGEIVTVTEGSDNVYRVKHAALGGLVLTLVRPNNVTTLTAGQVFIGTISGKYDGTTEDGQILYPGSPRVILKSDSVYTGTVDTRYKVTVTKGATQAFRRAQFTLAVTSGAITGATIKSGGWGYLPSQEAADEYDLTVIGATGTNAVLRVETDADGVITSVEEVVTDGTGYVNAEVGYAAMLTDERPTAPYAGAEIQVTDTAGIDRPQTYTVAHGTYLDLGTYGLRFRFEDLGTPDNPALYNVGLRKGDTFYIDAVAPAASGEFGILVLSGQVVDATQWDSADLAATNIQLDFRILFNGEVPRKGSSAPDFAWTATTDGIRVRNGLTLEVTTRDEGYTWVPVEASDFGRLFTHWRGLVPAVAGETIKLFRNEVDIKSRFGIEDQENPACMGALIAFRGSQNKGVYAARLRTNDLAGYVSLLQQAERLDGIYGVTPASGALDVALAVRDHVNKCSQDDWKLWRRAYLGVNSPGAYALLTVDNNNSTLLGAISANGSGNVVVTSEGANFITRGVRAGDLYRTSYAVNEWGESTSTDYIVLEVNSNDELILAAGPGAPIAPAIRFEIWRPDTGLSQAEFVGNRAESFANRRVCLVWSDAPLTVTATGSLRTVPCQYLAAEIAGLRSALVQQQGLTYTELDHALDRAPSMFTKFTQEELNLAASKGVMIITQETENGACFIRHQLTTKTTEGSLYYEDSVGFNLDMIAYGFKDVLQPFVGKQNATPETVDAIETKCRAMLDGFKSASGESIIGPALLEYSHDGKSGKLLVEIDPVFRDRINIGLNLELPLPINTIIATLNATTITNQTLAAVEAAA